MPSLPDEVVETTNEIRNEYDFRGGILTALGQEYTASDVRDKETFRQKLLTGLSQEYTQDDIKQTDLFRDKVVTGLSGLASGGGITTAEVTFVNNTNNEVEIAIPFLDQNPSGYYFNTNFYAIPGTNNPIITPLYDGQTVIIIPGHTIEVSGSATVKFSLVEITGNCTITIS